MSYTLRADIYLGDASSQVYEFLVNPRPCLFLNSHEADWDKDPNYAHWHLGPVVASIEELSCRLDDLDDWRADFNGAQNTAFERTFSTRTGASDRATKSLLELLNR